MRISSLTWVVLGGMCFAQAWMACEADDPSAAAFVPEEVDFNFHVRPILSDRCFACHGPDANAREAELRLDLEEHAFSPIDSIEGRYAIVAGSVDKSDLVKRIMSEDPEMMMPPPSSNLVLQPHEKEILQRWIEQGAEWKPHWAFVAPQKNQVPPIRRSKNAVNEIDHFVLNRLEQEGLKPAAPASKEKLIRRLSFDLRGLPPSLAEIDTFIADEREDAYEKLIDRFLADNSYGERMAMEWLDLARYADSHGYQDDLERSMWPWRDWVIESFNANMPYDQFVTWQLAGDLLPNATYEQKLATGFNRNHKITQEVGVVDEEYRVTYVLDRVNTFSTAFLGLTVECAQCHDHKYDPISQKEYYQLFSYFNHVPEKGRVDYGVEVAEPYLALPEEKISEVKKYIDELLVTQRSKVRNYVQDKLMEPLEWAPQKGTHENNSIPMGLHSWFPLDYVEDEGHIEVLSGQLSPAHNDFTPCGGCA